VSLLGVRSGERRDAWIAFVTLFGLIGSHAILETARDALFLAKVSASRLPWVYLATAALSLLAMKLQAGVGGGLEKRLALALWTFVASAVTAAFYGFGVASAPLGVYALYVWSGVLATLVLVHFWVLVGSVFSVTQAKRLYGFIGVGGAIGAIAGSGAAGLLARIIPAQSLLLVSACALGLTAVVPAFFRTAAEAGSGPERAGGFSDHLRYLAHTRYARFVVLYLLVSTTCLTLGDFLFKSVVAETTRKAELATFLGGVYFGLNVASLACQLLLVPRMLRRFTVGASLALLPMLVVAGGLGVAITGALGAVLALKAADGALRHSLHRTATEVLFLSFGGQARRAIKALAEVAGQRGGQVLGSLAILGAGALHAPTRVLALLLVVLGALWLALAIGLRAPYLEAFRARLKAAQLSRSEEFPELDVASLETLVATLDSRRDGEVIAALDVLEREQKTHLIPGLILYHPSEAVIERALAVFTAAGRGNVVRTIDRVLEHPSPRVRAAAIAARSVLAADATLLWQRLEVDESEQVRATITVNLIISGAIAGSAAGVRLETLLRSGDSATKIALAEAIGRRAAKGFADVLVTLASDEASDVRLAAIAAMSRALDAALVPTLIDGLAREATRTHAELALAHYGPEGLAALSRVLERQDSSALRWRIPHAMSCFDPTLAAAALLARLPEESDGRVRYQIICALERLVRRNPKLPLDRQLLRAAIDRTVSRAFRYLDCVLVLRRGGEADPARKTPGHELLGQVLSDKHDAAVARLFRLLGLAHPAEDFAQVHRGLSAGKDARATSMELIENVLREPLRSATRALVDDAPAVERLRHSGSFHDPLELDYAGLLSYLIESDSESVQDVTVFHLGELRRGDFRERIARLPNPDGTRSDVTLALALLSPPEERSAVP
jgi:AAA family ATP:ADP antiporter